MRTLSVFVVLTITLFLTILACIGVWFILYGLPQVQRHNITLHNVREDLQPANYEINGIQKTLTYGDSVSITVPNNTTITSISSGGQKIQTVLVWEPLHTFTDVYFFMEEIETNFTTMKLKIQNNSSFTYWIWIWPSQTPASVSSVNEGKDVVLYTYIGQQLAFSQSSQLGENQLYFFSPTSLSSNQISLGNAGITSGEI